MNPDTQGGLDQYREWSTEDLVSALTVDSDDYEVWAISAIRAELQRRHISPEEQAVLESEVLERVERERAGSQLQRRVDTLLRRGILFSIIWAAGVGSIIAIVSAVKAKKLIEHSAGEASGMRRVWFCLILGGLGVLLWGSIIAMSILRNVSAW